MGTIMPDIHSELAALKCELPTPLGRGYASRQEARKAAYGGEERKKEFSGDTPVPPAEGRGPLHSCFLSGCQA